MRNPTADAHSEVQRYMLAGHVARTDDTLLYWKSMEATFPHLFILATQVLCTPASSVPCERIFSKAGEIASKKKRNRLNNKTLEKLIFLNKNL